jgi:hypothetical protein
LQRIVEYEYRPGTPGLSTSTEAAIVLVLVLVLDIGIGIGIGIETEDAGSTAALSARIAVEVPPIESITGLCSVSSSTSTVPARRD